MSTVTGTDQRASEWSPPARVGSRGLVPLLCVLTLIAVAVCSVGLLISRIDAERRETLTARIESRNTQAAEFVNAYIESLMADERRLAAAVLSGPVTPAELDRISLQNGYAAAVLLDADGEALAVTSAALALLGQPWQSRYPHLARALEGKPAVSGVLKSATDDEVILSFAVPFDTVEGRRVFSVGHRPADSPLVAFTSNTFTLRTARALLVDGAGNVIISSDDSILPGDNLSQWPEVAAAAATSGYHDIDGEETFSVAGKVGDTQWRLVFIVETGELLAPVSGPSRLVPWGILVAFTIAALSAVAMWRRAHEEHQARLGYEQRLHALAMSDELTGLANRRVAVERLQQALARAKLSRTPVAVLYIDVDNFKTINDGFGHAAGDTVLIAVADRLRVIFRRQDTVARLGGDEFVVICEDLADADALDQVAARTRAALEEPYLISDGILVPGSSSVGFTTAVEGEAPETVLDRADRQMYERKLSQQTARLRAEIGREPAAAVAHSLLRAAAGSPPWDAGIG